MPKALVLYFPNAYLTYKYASCYWVGLFFLVCCVLNQGLVYATRCSTTELGLQVCVYSWHLHSDSKLPFTRPGEA